MDPNPYQSPQESGYGPKVEATDDDPLFAIATRGVIAVAGTVLVLIALALLVGMVTEARAAAMRRHCTNGLRQQSVPEPSAPYEATMRTSCGRQSHSPGGFGRFCRLIAPF